MKTTALFVLLVLCTHPSFTQDIYNRARASLAQGDTAGAVAAFTDAVKAGQRSAESNYYLGAIAYNRGRNTEAITYLEASLRSNDDNLDALMTIGNAYLKANDPTSALNSFRRAIRVAPKDCSAAIAFGRALLAADSIDAAVIQLTRAKECAPDNPYVYVGLGDAYQKQNVLVLAISNYQQAASLEPKNIELRYTVAQSLEKNRQYTEAVKMYDEVIAIDATYADAYLQKGSILYRAKLYARAVDPLKKFIELRPGHFDATSMLAKTQLEVRSYNEAATNARRAVELDSSAAETWRTYFYALVETKDFAGAESALAGLQRRTQLDVQDYLRLGDLYFGLKKREEALSWYLKAVAADSTNCEPFFNMGFLYMQGGQYAEAAVNFEKRIACDSTSLSAYINAAASLMQVKEYDRARTLLLKAIDLKSDFFQARLWLARYYVQVDSFDVAKQQYEEVLRLIGTDTEKYKKEAGEAHSLLASLHMTRKDYGRALESFRKAQAVGYENAAMHLSWGQGILQTLSPDDPQEVSRQKVDDAIKRFRRCVELDPNSSQGWLWLAEGLVRSRIAGDDEKNKQIKEEACGAYRRALRIDSRNTDAQKGLERIGC